MISHGQQTLVWYLNRLRAMSMPEVVHRIRELVLRTAGSLNRRQWPTTSRSHVCPVEHLGAFFAQHRMSVALRSVVAREAAKVRTGELELLGHVWPLSSSWPPEMPFWHTAPDESFSPNYAVAYSPVALSKSARNGRDLKRVWELNRLQFLVPFAIEAKASANQADCALAYDIVFSWMEANPPHSGLGYAAGIECALRAISVALMVSILGMERLDTAGRTRVIVFFEVHEACLQRFPSLYSSENNHRVAELAGLLVCAVMLDRCSEQRHSCLAGLLACLTKQFHEDGVGVEQSPTYAAFSIELSLLALAFLQVGPEECHPDLIDRLQGWLTFTLWMMDSAGRVPDIGDNDAGRGLAMTQAQEPRYVASIASMLAGWLRCPELSPPARDEHLRDAIYGSPASGGLDASGIRTWLAGGYSVFRGSNASYVLAFDHGPLGYLSIAAHGHADTLAIWLTVGETPVLIDAGTATYQPHDPLRARLRHTNVHNTLTIGDMASSIMSGPFHWSHKAQARVLDHDGRAVVAQHNGYRNRLGVIHQRRVCRIDANIIRIEDSICRQHAGPGPLPRAQSTFLLNPVCDIHEDGDGRWTVSVNDAPLVSIVIEGPLLGRVVGANDPDAELCATTFGKVQRTSRLVCEGVLDKDIVQTTTVTIHAQNETPLATQGHLHRHGEP